MLQPKDTDWLNGYKNKNSYIFCLQETYFIPQDIYRLKVRGWKNIFHANGKQKKAGVAILISDKTDLKTTTRDKGGRHIMIKGLIQEEDIKIVNIYPPNIKVKVKSLSCVLLFVIPWTVAHQAPLSMGFPRQEYWNGVPFPPPEIFLTEGSNLHLLLGRQLLYPWATLGSRFKRVAEGS